MFDGESIGMRSLSRLLCLISLVGLLALAPPAGAHDETCKSSKRLAYLEDRMKWTLRVDVADCAKGMRKAKVDVKIDLQRCDSLGCSAPVRKSFSCIPAGVCKRSVVVSHPEVELAHYRATWEYRVEGAHLHIGWGDRSADCLSTPLYRGFC